MKKIQLFILLIICTINANAQRIIEEQYVVKPTSSLDLNLEFADSIRIKQSSDNSVHIKAIVSINENQNNDKYELISNEENDGLRVKAKIHDINSIKIPCKNHKGSSYDYNDGKCLTIDIYYEIAVPTVANLKVKTISGNIIVDKGFYPMNIESISGYIDLSVPSKFNADVNLSTITGGIYTNLEFNKNSSDIESNPGGTNGTIKINAGGNKVKLQTISGDIFIRKI